MAVEWINQCGRCNLFETKMKESLSKITRENASLILIT